MPNDAHQAMIRKLAEDVGVARRAYDEATKTFKLLMSNVPSGLPHPDGAYRLEQSGKESRRTLELYTRALRRYSEFLIHGVIPDDPEP